MSSPDLLGLAVAAILPVFLALWLAPRCPSPPGSGWGSLSAGMLAAVAFGIILPEVYGSFTALAAGFLTCLVFDRFVHPVCAECGAAPAWPLWLALGLHSLLDGALLEFAQPGSAAALALALHRIPESLALVALLGPHQRRAPAVPIAALGVLVLAGFALASKLDGTWLRQSYAFAGGGVLFLSWHRMHRSWHDRTFRWSYSFSGAAAVCALHYGLEQLTLR